MEIIERKPPDTGPYIQGGKNVSNSAAFLVPKSFWFFDKRMKNLKLMQGEMFIYEVLGVMV
jgi:hypothetical protein